ncbi:MAG: hypothetical protein H0U44_02910 [Flavisolibacter sp.]|nr:hypothetical protein [Flavisolibacter sp.]
MLTIATTSNTKQRSFVLVSLHNNETTAINAGQEFVQEQGGQMVRLENDEKHNIHFEFLNKKYSIDPNKIFTQKGRASLLKSGPYKNTLSVEVQRFADYLFEIIPYNKHVIGLHNYNPGERSIKTFKKRKLARKIKTTNHNPAEDEGNFFVTTDVDIYNALKAKHYNVVLQNFTVIRDDGSLGLVVPKNRRLYVDVVAKTGMVEAQKKMIADLAELLDGR